MPDENHYPDNLVPPADLDAVQRSVWQELRAQSARIYATEADIRAIKSAFPRNDLQEPGYDIHRAQHGRITDTEKNMSDLTLSGVKVILKWVIGSLIAVSGWGFVVWMKSRF